MTDLRRALERQASYLVDVASTEGRRRRSRQPVRERVDAAFLGFQGAAAAREVELVNGVSEDLRTPPLFRAELQAVLTNLLSNAVKAAGSHGRVEVTGEPLPNGARLIVQNTGVAVRRDEAEGWFTPYASTTTNVDLVLGQGMGLGLPITRDLVAEYGGTVRFVEPSEGFSTAIEVLIPE
jgi:signal transduction histidine kinase